MIRYRAIMLPLLAAAGAGWLGLHEIRAQAKYGTPEEARAMLDKAVAAVKAEKAKALVRRVVPLLAADPGPCRQGGQHALDGALISAPEKRDPGMVERLDAVAGRVLRFSKPQGATVDIGAVSRRPPPLA